MGKKLDLASLEKRLWEAADELRANSKHHLVGDQVLLRVQAIGGPPPRFRTRISLAGLYNSLS